MTPGSAPALSKVCFNSWTGGRHRLAMQAIEEIEIRSMGVSPMFFPGKHGRDAHATRKFKAR
jgi:hypothetical protein